MVRHRGRHLDRRTSTTNPPARSPTTGTALVKRQARQDRSRTSAERLVQGPADRRDRRLGGRQWGDAMLAGNAPGTRASGGSRRMPQWKAGANASANWGGSSTAVFARVPSYPKEALDFAVWLNTDPRAIALLIDGGYGCPGAKKGSHRRARRRQADFFGGQEYNDVFADGRRSTSTPAGSGPEHGHPYQHLDDAFTDALADGRAPSRSVAEEGPGPDRRRPQGQGPEGRRAAGEPGHAEPADPVAVNRRGTRSRPPAPASPPQARNARGRGRLRPALPRRSSPSASSPRSATPSTRACSGRTHRTARPRRPRTRGLRRARQLLPRARRRPLPDRLRPGAALRRRADPADDRARHRPRAAAGERLRPLACRSSAAPSSCRTACPA